MKGLPRPVKLHYIADVICKCLQYIVATLYGAAALSANTRSTYLSEIADLDALSHFSETLCQFLHQLHLYIKGDGKIRILMSRIDSPSHIEIDIGRVLEQDTAYQGSPVVSESPFII